jgi:hypothetical protein
MITLNESAKEFLSNYLTDLEYQRHCDTKFGGNDGGVDHINHCSAGTPYFNSNEEADTYIAELKSSIGEMV